MTEQGPTPEASPSPSAAESTPQQPAAPPIAPAPYGTAGAPYQYATPPADEQRPRRSRWWVWLVVLAFLFLCVIASCMPFAMLSGSMGSSSASSSNPFAGLGGDAVAVITIDGTIQGTGGGDAVTPESMYDQIKRAEEDVRVKAIVLRVNSGGGTVAASEEIASYVKNAKKPVVVSVSDICASGAYMISSQADKIYAIEGSDVGSIGVIMQIPNVQGLLDKLGISVTTITSGKYKDAGSPFRKLTPEEQARLKGQVDEVYNQFIDIVASGRQMPRSKVAELATGWVWTGVEAKKLGLIDEIGTFPDAVAEAGRLGGIRGEPETIVYEEPLRDLLGSLGGLASEISPYGSATDPRQVVPK